MPDGTRRVVVLLAAFNGSRFIDEQLDSILAQRDVDVRVVVSVDASFDGTEQIIDQRCATDPRITALAHGQRSGGAAANFYRLMVEADIADATHVAFADQDDVWAPDKLVRAVTQLAAAGAAGYSSSVSAWYPNGREHLVDKAQAQRRWDHLFSSAGPGCTYVLTNRVFAQLADDLRADRAAAGTVEYHDWLIYAWVRTNGGRWIVDPIPSMRYRQHDANQIGANHGIAHARRRLGSMLDGWYLSQVQAVARFVGAEDELPITLLRQGGMRALAQLLRNVRELRRAPRDAAILATTLPLLVRDRKGDQP